MIKKEQWEKYRALGKRQYVVQYFKKISLGSIIGFVLIYQAIGKDQFWNTKNLLFEIIVYVILCSVFIFAGAREWDYYEKKYSSK